MKKDPALYQLVKSLSGPEKRHFILFLKRNKSESVNLTLFQELASLKDYNEKKLLEKYKNEAWTRQYHVACNYLFKLIMKNLHLYYSGLSIDQELKDIIKDVEILYLKALYDICEKHLKKARNLASRYEKQLAMLEIIDWERKVRQRQEDMSALKEHLIPGREEEKSILDIYKNRCEYRYLAYEMFLLSRKNAIVRDKKQMLEYINIINKGDFINGKALSFQAKVDKMNALCMWYRATEDHEKLYNSRKELVELNENNKEISMENPGGHIATMNNFIIACLYQKKYNEAMEYINKIKSFETRSEDIKLKIFTNAFSLELSYYIQTGEFETGLNLIDEIESGMQVYGSRLNSHQKKTFYYNMAYVCFGAGNFKKSLHYTNLILREKEADLRMDTHSFTRILNIIIHYELDNRDQLEYYIKSALRFLDTRSRNYKFESMVLSRFKSLKEIKSKNALKDFFNNFASDIARITEDPFEKRLLEYFDFNSWIESKITSKSFSEIVRNKSL